MNLFFERMEKMAEPHASKVVMLETKVVIKDDDDDIELPSNFTKRGMYERKRVLLLYHLLLLYKLIQHWYQLILLHLLLLWNLLLMYKLLLHWYQFILLQSQCMIL